MIAKKSLGQHFLVDHNILGVIDRLAALGRDDVVVEVGPGLGVLTTYLADRVEFVHTIEIDRTLVPKLSAALAARSNVRLHLGDALDVDLAALSPVPLKLVANLPYNIATPLVVESVAAAPAIEAWCVMVQKEVGERFFARPRTRAYGAVSVIMQLTTERTGQHSVARTVFRPVPNVDSVLVAFRRTERSANLGAVRAVVDAAFAHRRKTLANSMELRGLVPRARAEDALASIGCSARARAEELDPDDFVVLAEALELGDGHRRTGRGYPPRPQQSRARRDEPLPHSREGTPRATLTGIDHEARDEPQVRPGGSSKGGLVDGGTRAAASPLIEPHASGQSRPAMWT